METIKSYTDISQSRKLAEILPLDSADMGWYYSRNPQAARNQMWLGTKAENADIPCWSLAALLELMPCTIRNCQLTINKEGVVYNISYDDILSGEIAILYADCHLIDATFKMVIWLIEQGHIKVNDY